jgi:SAM-dependent methyltransferase
MTQEICPVCAAESQALDVVDFNKSCEELNGTYLPLANVPIYYHLCDRCGFCFAPEMHKWSIDEFASKVYNDGYIAVDPDYVNSRPQNSASNLNILFKNSENISHLDYGGGSGLLSQFLREKGWNSLSYDPFYDNDKRIEELGTFDLITAYEVFEHVPDVKALVNNLATLLNPDGIVIFSTMLSDGIIARHQRLSWWYASPRNGHISLFSRNSLTRLLASEGFSLGSFSAGVHLMWRKQLPPWASHLIRPTNAASELPTPTPNRPGFLQRLFGR